MHICLYVGTALPKIGGAEMVIDRLAREWKTSGHQVTLIAPRPKFFQRVDDSPFPYRVLRHAPFVSSRYGVHWYGRHLLRAHRQHRFDIVHCHGFYPHGYLAARLKNELGVPLVATSHGGDVAIDDLRYKKPRVSDRIHWGMRQLDAMIAISEFTRQGFLKHCPAGVRVVDIPNGVELDKYRRKVERPADWPSALKPREYFAFVGRFKHRKGIDVLLRAFEPIAQQTNFHLALAGDGEMRPALEQLAGELRIADRVHFLGMTRSQAKTYLMQNAAAGIVPSRVWEAFGLVAIEFMAAGRPVVVSDLTGIADLVRPGETGYIVPPDDPQRLSERLLSLVANPDKRERMAIHACRGAAAYDWHLIARHHLDLFEELLGKRQRLAA